MLVKMPIRSKKRQKRNISGLKNQSKPIPESLSTDTLVVEPLSNIQKQQSPDLEDSAKSEDDELGLRCPDSLKPLWRVDDDKDELMQKDEDSESETDGWDSQQELGEENLYIKLMSLAIDNGDDPRDEDWVPEGLRRKKQEKKGHFYCNPLWNETHLPAVWPFQLKGPDLGSKSAHTQYCY